MSEENTDLSTLLSVLHHEELIRIRHRLRKRGLYPLADFLTQKILELEALEQKEIDEQRKLLG